MNEAIIGSHDFVIAFWDGKSRGTKHAIEYATEQNNGVANPLRRN